MDLNQDFEIADLVTMIGKSIKKHGLKAIVKAIKSVDIDSNNQFFSQIKDFIESSICKKFTIDKFQLYDFKLRGNVTVARKLCVLLIKKHMKISVEEIGSNYNRGRMAIHNILKDFKNLNPNNKEDANFLSMYNDFDTKTEHFINSIKN